MTEQPTQTLQKHVDGAQVGKQKIRVDVETLLNSLCGYSHHPISAGLSAKHLLNPKVEQLSILCSETRVVRNGNTFAIEEQFHA